MNNLNYQTQKTGNAWVDETGVPVPFNRLSKLEKLREQATGFIIKDALKLNKSLVEFKTKIEGYVDSILQEQYKDKKLPKNYKGNFLFYNFDRSIKVEVNVNETIQFDDALIATARECLDEFIAKNVTGTDDVIRSLINSAFHNTKGGLDSKRVLSLRKYKSKIKAAKFHEALDLIDQSMTVATSRNYIRVAAKDSNGAYQYINLNFSSI
ncbi:MAG: DUF3164 family protein [Ginsengibacter sp.]